MGKCKIKLNLFVLLTAVRVWLFKLRVITKAQVCDATKAQYISWPLAQKKTSTAQTMDVIPEFSKN